MPPKLDEHLTHEIATVRKDINYPIYAGDRVEPQDETLIRRGGGGTARVYDIYQDILRDCHAAAILQKRYMEVIGREWEVVPASKDKADEKAADLCRDILNNLATRPQQLDGDETEISLAGGFDQTCLDLTPAILNGFSVSEIVWGQDGKTIFPAEIIQKDVRRFAFNAGDRGYKLRLLTWADVYEGEPIPPRKMIVHRFNMSSMAADPYGLGVGTRLFYPTFFKRNSVKFWLVFADKHGSPTAVIKHPKNASADDKATYKKALRSIAQDAGILLPEGVMIEFLEAQRGSSTNTYQELVDFCNEEMSKAVLGETGSTDQSGGGGSRARDEVGNSVRLAIAKFDADMLSDTLNRTLLTWITRLNLGDSAKPPTVWRKFPELQEKEDLNGRIGRDKQLFDLGFRISKEKVAEVYGDGYETSESANQEPPLVTRLGVSGTASFMQFLGQIASGSIPRENAVAALSIVFGMAQEEADAIVPKEEAIAAQAAKNPDAEPDIAAMLDAPAEPTAEDAPPAAPEETPPEDVAPPELAEGESLEVPELLARKTRKAVQRSLNGWIDQIDELVQGANSFEEIQVQLADLYPDLSPATFSAAIAQSMATANLAGRWEVLQEGEEVDLAEYEAAIAALESIEQARSLSDVFGADFAEHAEQFSDLVGILQAMSET